MVLAAEDVDVEPGRSYVSSKTRLGIYEETIQCRGQRGVRECSIRELFLYSFFSNIIYM